MNGECKFEYNKNDQSLELFGIIEKTKSIKALVFSLSRYFSRQGNHEPRALGGSRERGVTGALTWNRHVQ